MLGRKEFSELWVLKWAELLQIRSDGNNVSKKAMLRYFNWLQDKIAKNVPTNVWVKELLAANGGTFGMPATNYYQLERDVLKVTENVAQVFMGMRIQCAQCHNHPFDRWTMDDYYGFVSFFTQVGRKNGDDPREQVIFNSGGGEKDHPVDEQADAAQVPRRRRRPDVKPARTAGRSWPTGWPRRTTRTSPRTWRTSSGPTSSAAGSSTRSTTCGSATRRRTKNCSMNSASGSPGTTTTSRSWSGTSALSHTYQRATEPNESNEGDTRNFARGPIRRIRAETMLDIITQVTETKNKFPGLPEGARAVEIADGTVSNYFLTTFGRPQRETVCSCEVRLEPTLSQSLHLMNGNTVEPKIAQGGLVAEMLKVNKAPAEIVEALYVRCLSRRPLPAEKERLVSAVDQAQDKKQALEDVFWALLNSREFMFNH